MSVDNNGNDILSEHPMRRTSDHLLLEMYHTLKDLRNDINALNVTIAEEKLKQAHSEEEIEEFKGGMRKVVDRIEQLTINEAKSSVKFGLLTFVATLVFVTAFNLFVDLAQAEELRTTEGLPPPKMEPTPKKEPDYDE